MAKKREPVAVDDPLLNLSEVAKLVNKTSMTVGRWCQDGLLKCVRLPSGLRAIRKSEVEKFIGNSALSERE